MKEKNAVHSRALRGLAVLCLCAVLLLGTAGSAFAAGSLVTIKVDDTRLLQELKSGTEVSLSLFKIAGRTGSGWNFAEAPLFAGLSDRITAYEAALQKGSRPSDTELLSDIADLILKNSTSVKPVATKRFSASGSLSYDGLSEGLYFFAEASGPDQLRITNAIIPVPFTYAGKVLPSGIETTMKVEWIPDPTPSYIPVIPVVPYTPPTNPNTPIAPAVNPPAQNANEIIIEDYDTPLGIAVEFNHVGDCYE